MLPGTQIQEYKYKFRFIFIPVIMVLFGVPYSLIVLILSFVLLIQGKTDFLQEQGQDIIAIIFILIILSDFMMKYVNEYANVRVHSNGLRVRVFVVFYFWKFIPWNSIKSVEETNAYDRWGKPIFLIVVKDLSIWHCMIGQQYGYGWKPAILLSSDMENYEELFTFVKDKFASINTPDEECISEMN